VDFSEESLSEAKGGLDRFYTTLHAIQEEMVKPAPPPLSKRPSPSMGEVGIDSYRGKGGGGSVLAEVRQAVESFQAKVEEAMDDDFNTAQALGYFHELQTHLNSVLNLSKSRPAEEVIDLLKQGSEYFLKLGWIFGLFRDDPKSYIDDQKQAGLKKLNLREEDILKLIEERNTARKEKNWKRADDVRNDLLARGIVLEDTPSGTQWKLK
jgi:cysteinyl-tRNA synthetase